MTYHLDPKPTIKSEFDRAIALIQQEHPNSDPIELYLAMTRAERRGWIEKAREA